MNPLLLLGAIGTALPIFAHLLNKHQFKQTDWAAMQFLNRAVNVRSRPIKLRDLLLPALRCAVILLIVFAITYRVETSTGLQTWTTTGVTTGAPDADGLRTASSNLGPGRPFLRLVIQATF